MYLPKIFSEFPCHFLFILSLVYLPSFTILFNYQKQQSIGKYALMLMTGILLFYMNFHVNLSSAQKIKFFKLHKHKKLHFLLQLVNV